MHSKWRRLLPLLILGATTPLQAQEEQGGLLSVSTGLTFWTILTFLVVLAVLWKMALPPILAAVEAREQQIRDLTAIAAKEREEARVALEENRRQLEETRARIQELVAEGRTAGERLRDDIIAEARKQAEEILDRARRNVQQELNRAMQEMRHESVDIALAAAGRLIDRNLDAEDNRRLVREYLDELEGGREEPAMVRV